MPAIAWPNEKAGKDLQMRATGISESMDLRETCGTHQKSVLVDTDVVGWKNFKAMTGVGKQIAIRWMRLYQFPNPTKVGSYKVLKWDRRDIAVWMARNKEIVDDAHKRIIRIGGKLGGSSDTSRNRSAL